jgi:hypothetical protein
VHGLRSRTVVVRGLECPRSAPGRWANRARAHIVEDLFLRSCAAAVCRCVAWRLSDLDVEQDGAREP